MNFKGDHFLEKEDGTYLIRLAGVSYEGRQEYLKKMNGKEKLKLKREKNNYYDPNAVAVYTKIKGKDKKIGYIPAVIAKQVSWVLDSGSKIEIEIDSFTEETYKRHEFIGLVMHMKERIKEHPSVRLRLLFE